MQQNKQLQLTLTVEGSQTPVTVCYGTDPRQARVYDGTTEITHLLTGLQRKYVRDRIAAAKRADIKLRKAVAG